MPTNAKQNAASRLVRAGLAVVRRNDGIAALEFALIAPVFLALIFGIIVYGIYFATWVALTEAASEGARASVAGLNPSQRLSYATTEINNFFAAASPLLNVANATITAQQAPNSNGGAFEVSITYNFASYGFSTLASLVPLPAPNPTVTIIVSNGS